MTWRHGTVTVSFSSYSGENLPCASNTRVHFLKTTPLTWPSSSRTSFGPQPQFSSIPSSSASSISSLLAGIFSLASRQNMEIFASIHLLLILAASMATFPPPTTTTSPSSAKLSFAPAFLKKSTAVYAPSAFSPLIPGFLPLWQPIAA